MKEMRLKLYTVKSKVFVLCLEKIALCIFHKQPPSVHLYPLHPYQITTSTYDRHIHFIPKKCFTFKTVNLSTYNHRTILMYSTLPTLNNKKITAMFYVHLFLKAMYRKTTGKTKQNKNWLCISRMCRMCRRTLSSWKYWSCRKLLHQM